MAYTHAALAYFKRGVASRLGSFFTADISCKCGIFPRNLLLLMLWWEGRHGGERHCARHRTNTSAASADRAGSRGGRHWEGLPAVSHGVGTGVVPATAQPREPPPSQEGGSRSSLVRVQPAVDRSLFRKSRLSPMPLQQAIKLLATQKIKRQSSGRANRRWEGLPTQVMAKQERVNGYPCSWHIWQRTSV